MISILEATVAFFKALPVEQVGTRLFLRGLPVANPDRVAQVPVIKLECATRPRMPMDWSYEDPEEECK